jgi:hypothetical protein
VSGFYLMRFKVPTDHGLAEGAGALSFKRGVIVGVDSAGVRYDGTYVDENGRIRASIILDIPAETPLTTGVKTTMPTRLALPLELSADFADGRPHKMEFDGRSVEVTFEKLAGIE